MATKLPYVAQPTLMNKILDKVQEARAPDRFTYDFLETKLGFKGGNYRQFVSLAKKLNLLRSDGSPTDLYKGYRNKSSAGGAMALALKHGYKEIFDRNEYAYNLSKEKFKDLVVEITGLEPNNRVVQLICQTWEILKAKANFDEPLTISGEEKEAELDESTTESNDSRNSDKDRNNNVDLNLSYTINLVLPKTDDPAVFNAIFRSLRENLLRR